MKIKCFFLTYAFLLLTMGLAHAATEEAPYFLRLVLCKLDTLYPIPDVPFYIEGAIHSEDYKFQKAPSRGLLSFEYRKLPDEFGAKANMPGFAKLDSTALRFWILTPSHEKIELEIKNIKGHREGEIIKGVLNAGTGPLNYLCGISRLKLPEKKQ